MSTNIECISHILGMNTAALIDDLEKADNLEVVSSKATLHMNGPTSRSKVFQMWFSLVLSTKLNLHSS